MASDKSRLVGAVAVLFLTFCIGINADKVHYGANRCGFAPAPNKTRTIWKYAGEDVTFACPGYKLDSSASFSVEYYWHKQDYICAGMDPSTVVASYIDHVGGSSQAHPEKSGRIQMDKATGELKIRNFTKSDEHTYTCILNRMEEYIATVDLKIKEFEEPQLTGLSDVIVENDARSLHCEVPRMKPMEGFIKLKYNGSVMTSKKLIDGDDPQPLVYSITGKAKANGDEIACIAVQNVSCEVRQLSTSDQVRVQYPYHTRVLKSNSSNQPMEFSDITLSCDITRQGNPEEIMKYTWMKDGQVKDGQVKDGQEKSTCQNLTLRRVTQEDVGSYKCLITNEPGMSTPLSAAQELQLDVVPLKCLPQLAFKDIKMESKFLNVSWHPNYPCRKWHPDTQLLLQMVAGNESILFQNPTTLWLSEKHVTVKAVDVNRHFDTIPDQSICLVLANYPDKKYCATTGDKARMAANTEHGNSKVLRAGSIAGYTVLGCVITAVVISIISAMISERKRRIAAKSYPVEPVTLMEDPYEDLEKFNKSCEAQSDESFTSQRDRLASFSGSVRYCEEGTGLPGLMMNNNGQGLPSSRNDLSDTPPPPPLPDFNDLIGRPLDPCPLAESHYNNRTTIMASMPRKKSVPTIDVPKSEDLESLLQSCQDNYGICPKYWPSKEETPLNGDYIDMRAAEAAKAAAIEAENAKI